MTAAPIQKVEQIFLAVTEWRNAHAGEALTDERLDEFCGHDADIRAEVQSLLHHLDQAGDDHDGTSAFLNPNDLHGSHAAAMSRDAALEEWGGSAVGQRVGDFIIIGQLGAGAMGIVYLAEQQHPRRTVALKVIRRTLTTPATVARFKREAELLARLSHSGIAQIYATGVADVMTADGGVIRVPFIAMELVNGLPILDHVNETRCGVREILRLTAQACDAIQHAHQRGVVHRDLKPANLLVAPDETESRIKVLDFGIARAMESDSTEESLTHLTMQGYLVGTPAYMSPEQIQGRVQDIDGRSDVYALGAILFQLLTGRHAIDLAGCSLPDAIRRVVDQAPLKLAAVDRKFRGNLETIVAKAMEKTPARRYASAADLAQDIRRFVSGDAIRAKAPPRPSRLAKFALTRGPAILSLGTLVALAVAFIVYANRQAILLTEATEAAAKSSRESDIASALLSQEAIRRQVEEGLRLALEGDITAAETILWDQYRLHPKSRRVRAGLRELYARQANIRLIDAHARECRARVMGEDGPVSAAAGDDDTIWFSYPGTSASPRKIRTSLRAIQCLQFNADGTRLLAAGTGGMVMLNPSAASEPTKFPSDSTAINAADLSHDGKYIVATDDDGRIRIWNTTDPSPLLSLPMSNTAGRSVRFDRTATHVASTFGDGNVWVWTLAWHDGKPEVTDQMKFPGPPGKSPGAGGFNPDGSILACAFNDGSVLLWAIPSGGAISALKYDLGGEGR